MVGASVGGSHHHLVEVVVTMTIPSSSVMMMTSIPLQVNVNMNECLSIYGHNAHFLVFKILKKFFIDCMRRYPSIKDGWRNFETKTHPVWSFMAYCIFLSLLTLVSTRESLGINYFSKLKRLICTFN